MLDISPEDITEGPLLRALLLVAAPLLVQNFVQVAQQVVDLFWLGRLSGTAVAAVGLAFPVYALLVGLVVLAPFVGTQVLVSQRVGAVDVEGARRAVIAGFTVALVLGVVGGALAFVGARPLVDLLTATRPRAVAGEVPGLAAAYLGVIALGLPALALSDTVEASFVGWGDSRASMYLNFVAVGINVVLDPILIFGVGPAPALGIRGAALATVLGYALAFLFGLGLMLRGRNGGMVSRAAVTVDVEEHYELLDIGLPSAAQRSAQQTVRVLVIAVVFAAGGPPGLAAYIVGARVASVAFIPAHGLQQAAQSVVGQNLGAERPARAARATWLGVGVAAGTLAGIGALQWLVPGPVTTLLVPDIGPEAFALSVEYLRILAYGYPGIGATYLFEAGFNGARRTRTSFVAAFLQYAAVRLPIAAVGGLVLGFGVSAVFWAVTISNLVAAAGLGAYYRHSTADGMLERATRRAAAE